MYQLTNFEILNSQKTDLIDIFRINSHIKRRFQFLFPMDVALKLGKEYHRWMSQLNM